MREPFRFGDNVGVGHYQDGNHYFAIQCFDSGAFPDLYDVGISRYSVPGRCNVFSFSVSHGQISCSTEGTMSMVAAMKLVSKDLNRAEVAGMLLKSSRSMAFYYWTCLRYLVQSLAPRSRSAKVIEKEFVCRQAVVNKRVAELREKRKQEDGS